MPITDVQQAAITALGDNPVKASIKLHRDKLEKVSNDALQYIAEDLPEATIDQKVKIYDTTRKHLNVIDGIDSANSQEQPIIVIPGELVINPTKEIRAQVAITPPSTSQSQSQNKKLKKTISQSNSTNTSQKSHKTPTDSGSLIVEGVLEKPSSQDMNLSQEPASSKKRK